MSPKSFGSINKIGKIVGNASFWRSYCRNFPASPSPRYLFPNRIHFSGSFPCTALNYGGICVAVRWRIAESLLAHLYSGFRFDAASDERLSRAYWGSGVFSLDGLQPLVAEVFVSISFPIQIGNLIYRLSWPGDDSKNGIGIGKLGEASIECPYLIKKVLSCGFFVCVSNRWRAQRLNK